jgi:hydrogenase maturation protease
MRILVAGIGNIFFGDDGFGCEVVAHLAKRSWPDGVKVVDFGIRAYDLAYAIMDSYDATILIDAAPRGEKPGTVYLLELDPHKIEIAEGEIADPHALTPVGVLQMVRALGGRPNNLYLVGCEPAQLDGEGKIGLSKEICDAVPLAAKIIDKMITDLISGRPIQENDANRPPAHVRCFRDGL